MQAKYWAKATATGGGRKGHSRTDDGKVDVELSVPKESGGDGGPGTNPEQLFATGYAACFLGAFRLAAGRQHIKVADEATVTAHVGIGDHPNGVGFQIAARLELDVPGMDADKVREIAEAAHHVCPYSNATRGNIEVETVVA